MCDAVVLSAIQQAVQEFIDNPGYGFTLYDVTKRVREIVGKGKYIYHNDIRNDILNEVVSHDVRTSQHPVHQCRLFTPSNTVQFTAGNIGQSVNVGNPVSIPTALQSHKTAQNQQSVQATARVLNVQNPPTGCDIHSSSRGRFVIQARFLKSIGYDHGDTVPVEQGLFNGKPALFIPEIGQQRDTPVTELKADKYVEIKLSPSTVRNTFGDTQNLNLSVVADQLESVVVIRG